MPFVGSGAARPEHTLSLSKGKLKNAGRVRPRCDSTLRAALSLYDGRATCTNVEWPDLVLSRRKFLVGCFSSFLLTFFKTRPAAATIPDQLLPLVREVSGNEIPKTNRVKLTLPAIAESGNSVPLKVQVESPMTADDYVKSIHIFSEKNPRPVIARFYLNPRSGKAQINTRIRLAGSQQVVAVAVMSDGSSWSGTAEVIVTAAACLEGSA